MWFLAHPLKRGASAALGSKMKSFIATTRGLERALGVLVRARIPERCSQSGCFPSVSRNGALVENAHVAWVRRSQVAGCVPVQSTRLLESYRWDMFFLQKRAASRSSAADDATIQTTSVRSNGKEWDSNGKQLKVDADSGALVAKKRVRGKHKLRQDEEETFNNFPTPFPSNVRKPIPSPILVSTVLSALSETTKSRAYQQSGSSNLLTSPFRREIWARIRALHIAPRSHTTSTAS